MFKVLKGNNFRNSDFLFAFVGLDPSFIWRSLLWGRELLSLGLRWRVGDGSKISVFKYPWIPFPSLFKPISPPSPSYPEMVKDLILPPHSWNVDLI